jgi:predicted Fe-Mo cluster-binding NifX family protein
MKIAIAAPDKNIYSHVDPHFGRCNWFCIFEPDTGKIDFIENTFKDHEERAGCEAALLLAKYGVNIVIAGRFGTKVIQAFREKNLQMIIPDKEKTVNEIIDQLK